MFFEVFHTIKYYYVGFALLKTITGYFHAFDAKMC